jgi:uncharacterized protein
MAVWSVYNLAVADPPGGGALVFNTRTGVLVRLDESRLRQLGAPDPVPEDLAEFLLRQGFLVPDGCDELGLVRRRHAAARTGTGLFTATVELTESCNFRCGYCYQDHRPRRLDRALGDRVVAYLVGQMRGRRHLHVNWFGGEPLLAFARLREMSGALSTAASGDGWTLTPFITTNGYLLARRRAGELVDLGVAGVQITVDGDAADHDRSRPFLDGRPTYRRVLAGCVNAVAAGLSLVLRINVSRSNQASVPVLLEQLRPQGLVPANTVVHATRMVGHGNGTGDGRRRGRS